ncbi:hypothetical protein [Thermobacillus sp. ZCTH02-B1]|uniref:hypothetical protein n=1 Tax=Thermobacillus sp. ZCTH02-B1 TaxID=1858795 RepID=UPI0025D90617|nr:hypothetical protein [Thermobacillus sp. ZCTH02-B1]
MRSKSSLRLAAAPAVLFAGTLEHRAASDPSGHPAYRSRELILLEEEKSTTRNRGSRIERSLKSRERVRSGSRN